MAHFHRMPQFAAAQTPREQPEECLEVGPIDCLGGQELPVDRTQLVAELEHAAREEAFDRGPRLREPAAVRRKPGPLDREHETRWHLFAPARETGGLLRAVEGAVDLDRTQPA